MKKVVSIILVLALALGCMVTVSAVGDMTVNNITADNGMVVFNKSYNNCWLYYKNGESVAEITVDTDSKTKVYKGEEVNEDTLCANNKFTLNGTGKKYFCVSNGEEIKKYTVSCETMGENAVDAKVVGYLCAPSQYTNGTIGCYPEKTVTGTNALMSLGNFGGYVTYCLNDKIFNSPKHKYGVDFIVTGNAFNANATTQEPGQVYVSQDGDKWYPLAGSEHYEDETVWDYSVKYINNNTKKSDFEDSLGDSGAVSSTSASAYPMNDVYSQYGVNVPEDSITLSGVLLRKTRTASTANGISTSFGYTDALPKGDSSSTNPYLSSPSTSCKDGRFDISWAVDENGNPINLDWIKYIKVQTATFIDGAIFGEKSTEISGVYTVPEEQDSLEKTSSVSSVKVNSMPIDFSNGNVVDMGWQKGEIKIDVECDDDTNIYINNENTSEKVFSSVPSKKIIRVIAQKGEQEPEIYYLRFAPDTVTVSFSCFDGSVIMPKQTITVTDGIAEQYGYQVAQKNHNDEKISGVTAFDVLVAANKLYYGDAFTKETARNYLDMSSSFVSKAFGKSAYSSGFTFDGICPNDGIYNPDYGSYTGYACDTAEIDSGEYMSYFFYQDTSYYSDNISWFTEENKTVTTDTDFTLSIEGYTIMYYGCATQEKIDENIKSIPSVDIYASDGKSEYVKIGTTDESGNAVLSFSKPGTYSLYAKGMFEGDYGDEYIIAPWCTVTVNQKITPVQSVNLDKDSVSVNYKSVCSLNETVLPTDADNKNVVWHSSDESVAQVDENGNVTAVGRGTATITVKTVDGNYCDECKVEVKYSFWQWVIKILLFGWIWY